MAGEFTEDGTETHFTIGHEPACVRAVSSGNRIINTRPVIPLNKGKSFLDSQKHGTDHVQKRAGVRFFKRRCRI